jgi:hypothetical protein
LVFVIPGKTNFYIEIKNAEGVYMKITEIIKDAFLFPSRNTGGYAIYLLLSVLIVLFALGGILTNALGIIDSENYLTGGMYLLISMLIGILIGGYHIKVIKSGINHEDRVPVFKLYDDFMIGFDNVVVLIAYSLIPAMVVAVVAYGTNLFGYATDVGREFILQIYNVYIMGNSADITVISNILNNLAGSLGTTMTVALVLFIVFSFLQGIAEARLANTGSLKEALNIFETLKDIKRIGIGRMIILALLVVVLFTVIELILAIILSNFPFF